MKRISKLMFLIPFVILAIYSSALPQGLNIVGSCPIPGRGFAIEVAGNFAYVAADTAGLQIIDVTDPANPAIVSSYNTPGRVLDLFIAGQYAYLADYSSMQIVDISNPLLPAFVGSYPTVGSLGIHIYGYYAYVASGYHSPVISILNISNPASPESTSGLSFLGGAFALYYSNSYLSILSNETEPYANYLRTIDVTNPQNPFIAGNVRIPGEFEIPLDVMVAGDYAFVGDQSNGLQIVNVHDPANPMVSGSYDTPGRAYGVYVSDGHAFIADYHGGVQLLDVSDPSDPVFIANAPTEGYAIGVTVQGEYAYVITDTRLYVMRPEYPSGCVYIVGDVNDNGVFNGLDVVYSVSYFKGGLQPPYSCDCDSDYVWFVSGDVNASCNFNGLDVSYMVAYFKGGPLPIPCPDCPPTSGGYRHDDIRGDCLGGSILDDSSYMILEIVGNDLHINHIDATYQCCLLYFVSYRIAANDITATEYDNSPPCDCICRFDLESILYDLDNGLYTVRLIGIYGDTVGVDRVTIGAR